ncbi:MAG: signal peptidase I [Erysipelotrichaceae bacterium]|nr:signal peptidase I [Erysipelotrichaceae bacterium]
MTKKSSLQKSLIIFAKTIASLVIIGVILVLIPLSVPRLLGYETFNVISGSMEPELPVGSLLLVKKTSEAELSQGDIIAFYSNGTIVTHRVVSNNVYEQKLKTKGDANADEDIGDVAYSEVIGKVMHHYPYLGSLGEYFSSVSGKLSLAELLICAVLVYVVAGRIRT